MGKQFFPPKSWILKWKSQYKVWDAFLLVIGQASEVPQTTQVTVVSFVIFMFVPKDEWCSQSIGDSVEARNWPKH